LLLSDGVIHLKKLGSFIRLEAHILYQSAEKIEFVPMKMAVL